MSERIRRGQRQRWPDAIYDRAEQLLNSLEGRPSGAAIAKEVALEFDPAPEPRTINEWIRKGLIRYDPSEPWTFADADPDEAVYILPVLRAWVEWSGGRYGPLSKRQAEWIVRIRKAVPDIPLAEAAVRALGQPSELETYLAWAPWRHPDDAAAYANAYRKGWIRTFVLNDWAEFPGPTRG